MKGRELMELVTLGKLSSLSAMWGNHEKVVAYNPRKQISPEPDHAGTLLLDLPFSRIVGNEISIVEATQSGVHF